MNIAVCEDTLSDRDALCAYIQSYCGEHSYNAKINAYGTGEALLDAFSAGAFNLIFLDIFMPGMNGVETAKEIRETDRDCMLVFVTTSADFAMDGFLVQASGYVVKPISREKMAGAMHACRFEFEKNSRTIEIPQGGGCVSVSIADLLYTEVYGKESVFHMKQGKIKSRLPLETVETRLGGSPFLRCHRSYIVNMNYVDDMRDEDFLMRNGDVVPIRVNGRKQVRMAMAGFIARSPMEVK
ncbi:MAG: LytTR family DNA-binding domain-containing protein [Oscillospiraceae bacterium]|nr:LytTR family DNA-binding domain-containing protein [Oscillospiraceae bacterium]